MNKPLHGPHSYDPATGQFSPWTEGKKGSAEGKKPQVAFPLQAAIPGEPQFPNIPVAPYDYNGSHPRAPVSERRCRRKNRRFRLLQSAMKKTTCKPTNRLLRIHQETKRPELWIDDTPLPGFNYWGSHPKAPVDEWQIEVKNGDTRRGYWAWVRAILED